MLRHLSRGTKTRSGGGELRIVPLAEETAALYEDHKTFHDGDSGLDLYVPYTTVVKAGETKIIPLKIKAAAFDEHKENVSFLLFPRSSICKTPLRLANSVGLIDAGYRGELCAAVDNIKMIDYTIEAGTRLFQAVFFNGKPFRMKVVQQLDETSRGAQGFGSTNK